MNCQELKRFIKGGEWLQGGAEAVLTLQRHLDRCPSCRAEYGPLLETHIRLGQWGSDLREEPVPDQIRATWEATLAGAHQVRGGLRLRGWRLFWRATAAVLAAALLFFAACFAVPGVCLQVGAVPGLGPLLRQAGADRGLQVAAGQGFTCEPEAVASYGPSSVTLRQVVGDPTRVALLLYAAGRQPFETGGRTRAVLRDQWGRIYRECDIRQHLEAPDRAWLTLEFPGLQVQTRRLELEISELMGWEGRWRLGFPVDLAEAESATRIVPAFREARSGPISLRVSHVVLAPGQTVVHARLEGLEVGSPNPEGYRLYGVSYENAADENERWEETEYRMISSLCRKETDGQREARRLTVSFEPVRGGHKMLSFVVEGLSASVVIDKAVSLPVQWRDGEPQVPASWQPANLWIQDVLVRVEAYWFDQDDLHLCLTARGRPLNDMSLVLRDAGGLTYDRYSGVISSSEGNFTLPELLAGMNPEQSRPDIPAQPRLPRPNLVGLFDYGPLKEGVEYVTLSDITLHLSAGLGLEVGIALPAD